MASKKHPSDPGRRDRLAADIRERRERERGYRAQALRILPWICGRCGREFSASNLRQLTVHHKDHNHHNNPSDGSNWELLCVYCHDNEHSRYADHVRGAGLVPEPTSDKSTHRPFASLDSLLNRRG